MNTAIEDLKALHISNLNTIKGLNIQVKELESEKKIQIISNFNSIKELNEQIEQIESERKIQYANDLTTIKALNEQIEILELEKNTQYNTNSYNIKELNNRITQLESEKDIQFTSDLKTITTLNKQVVKLESDINDQFQQFATGIIIIIEALEKLKKAVSKKELKKTAKGKKILNRYKKTRKSLEYLVMQLDISKITFPDNQLIESFCKVVGTEPDASKPDNTILTIVKNGYIRGDELIREAEVIVVKNEEVSLG